MKAASLSRVPPLVSRHTPSSIVRELRSRHPLLAAVGLALAAAMLPALVALWIDDRTLRGVNVWVKPLKFMAASSLFLLTLAWFTDLVDPAQRTRRSMRWMAGLAIATACAEVAYITWQAALGEASHYNASSRVHLALYSLMGAAALALTATQLILAVVIVRHGRQGVAPVWRAAVVAGLVLGFLMGAVAGGLLGSMQPPPGSGLPLVGWHLSGGDLRPAHFVGLHVTQMLPFAALWLVRWPVRPGLWALSALALACVLLWAGAIAMGLDGAVLTPMIPPASPSMPS